MLTFFGARERTLREWEHIIMQADQRFEVNCRDSASGSSNDLLKVVWGGNSDSNGIV